jgi:hypothetical protein
MALILDDRDDVWPSDLNNLIKVKPYKYFQNMADVNNAAGTSIVDDQSVHQVGNQKNNAGTSTSVATSVPLPYENDDELTHVLRVLLDIHAKFYHELNGGEFSSSSSSMSSVSSTSSSGKRRRGDGDDVKIDPASLKRMVAKQVIGQGPSVQKILREIRESVFNGVHMVFSGIIKKNTGIALHNHSIWKQAELFGASIR